MIIQINTESGEILLNGSTHNKMGGVHTMDDVREHLFSKDIELDVDTFIVYDDVDELGDYRDICGFTESNV